MASSSSWDMEPPEVDAGAGAAAGAGAGSGSGSGAVAAKESAKGSKSRFARLGGMMFMNSLFNFPSISNRKRTTTMPSFSVKYVFLNSSGSPISKDLGVDIFTIVPKNSESAVADAPIIWFITSQMALMWISSISKGVSSSSTPIMVLTMMRTSSRRNIMIFFPSRPST